MWNAIERANKMIEKYPVDLAIQSFIEFLARADSVGWAVGLEAISYWMLEHMSSEEIGIAMQIALEKFGCMWGGERQWWLEGMWGREGLFFVCLSWET